MNTFSFTLASFLITLMLVLTVTYPVPAVASGSNPNLFVSAENSQFENHFSGSMVIEVIVIDPDINYVDQIERHPYITINGDSLQMVQAVDGNWYAYFANLKRAQEADSTVGLTGRGLDFGAFCSSNTPSSVFGVSFPQTQGFAIPRIADGSTHGTMELSICTGTPSGPDINNVLRHPRPINTHPGVPPGQIGLDPDAWPLIQLFSFKDVSIMYNPGGRSQQVSLEYDEIPNISMSIDRKLYPSGSHVFLTVNDFQLNQDPTDRDSWTFGVTGSTLSTFYQAFTRTGLPAAAGGAGLVNLAPHLSDIGFEDNGALYVNPDRTLEFGRNAEQPRTSISNNGQTFTDIITLVENSSNSGIFDSADRDDKSVLKIFRDASRDGAGYITYNGDSISVLTGSSSAAISLSAPTLRIGNDLESMRPGTEYSVTLFDPDQNTNSGIQDVLAVYDERDIIPTMRIGDPVTLGRASDVNFYASSTDSLLSGDSADSSVPDPHSARLLIDTSGIDNGGSSSGSNSFEKISLNLGVTASKLKSVLIDTSSSDSYGTNWINYDFRSFANDLGVSDFSDTRIDLSFGTLGASLITIVDSGTLFSPSGLLRLDDSDVQSIVSNRSGPAYLIINFDASDDNVSVSVGTLNDEFRSQPIIFDLFAFGLANSRDVNNSLYRFELEETSNDSSTFHGTFHYAVANQLNISDPKFIRTIVVPISDKVKALITGDLASTDGITVSYSDLDVTGYFTVTSAPTPNINTHSGKLSANSASYRFGQPVVLTLHDPDLNLSDDLIDIYRVIDNALSPNVDTVGRDGIMLFEVLLKDIRYKRCTVNGIEHGGLGATGFSLVETGTDTGTFEGSFRMPLQICNKSGTDLISSASGRLDVKYYDSNDSEGNQNVFSLLKNSPAPHSIPAKLSTYHIAKPFLDTVKKEVVLSGTIKNPERGTTVAISIAYPDGRVESFGITLPGHGAYRYTVPIDKDALVGVYDISLSYANSSSEILSFTVSDPAIPDLARNSAKLWSIDGVSDSEFIAGIKYLYDEEFIVLFKTGFEQKVPNWFKAVAEWWADGKISDEDFLISIQYMIKVGIIVI